MITCPHCRREFSSRGFRHICPEDPARRDVIRGALEDPARPGVARSTTQYRYAAVHHGAPDIGTLLKHFDTWRACCEHYGLAYSVAPCPHCNRATADPAHITGCAANPANRAAIIAVMEDPVRPGYAINSHIYEERARGTGAPGVKAIRGAFGDWQAACKHFGLEFVGQRSQSREAAAMAEVAEAVDADRELQRELETRGLEVCSVRALPDGRVACLLR